MKGAITRQADLDVSVKDNLIKLQDSINSLQSIFELDSRSSDPTLEDSSGKIQIWYRSDVQQIRFNDNGTIYKIQAAAA